MSESWLNGLALLYTHRDTFKVSGHVIIDSYHWFHIAISGLIL